MSGRLCRVIDPEAHDVRSRDFRLYSLYDDTLSIEDPIPEGVDTCSTPGPNRVPR